MIIPAFVCTCWHFYELSNDPDSGEKSQAIIDEISNIAAYFSRVSYATAVNVKDPRKKTIAVGVMVVANICYSGLQTAEVLVSS